MLQYVLRFVAGKDQGREFPLPPDLIIVIGRVNDADLLLLDEKISRKHALALINTGNAGAEDIVRLKENIQRGVQDAWGVMLEPEPVSVGF